MWRNWNLHTFAGGLNVKCCSGCGKVWQLLKKLNKIISNFTPRYRTKRIENRYSNKYLLNAYFVSSICLGWGATAVKQTCMSDPCINLIVPAGFQKYIYIYKFDFNILLHVYRLLKEHVGASLVAQWLRICLLIRGHGFEPWSGKIPHAAEQLGL